MQWDQRLTGRFDAAPNESQVCDASPGCDIDGRCSSTVTDSSRMAGLAVAPFLSGSGLHQILAARIEEFVLTIRFSSETRGALIPVSPGRAQGRGFAGQHHAATRETT